jgi:hypothetical protein
MIQSGGKYELVSSNDMEISGSMGKEYILDFKDNGITAKGRIVITGNWLYQVAVAGKRPSIESGDADEYLRSFKIE